MGERAPHDGLVPQESRASEPDTDVWAARIDLCADSVHVQASQAPSGVESTGSTVMGLSQDRQTLWLVSIDGRT